MSTTPSGSFGPPHNGPSRPDGLGGQSRWDSGLRETEPSADDPTPVRPWRSTTPPGLGDVQDDPAWGRRAGAPVPPYQPYPPDQSAHPGPAAHEAAGSPWRAPSYDRVAPRWLSTYGQGGPVTAARGARISAALLDSIILTVSLTVLMVVSIVTVRSTFGSSGAGTSSLPLGDALFGFTVVGALVLPMVAPLLYYGYFDGRGGTPGKRICGLRLVGTATGEPIGFWRAVTRRILLQVAASVFLLGYLSILFDSSGQDRGWHDVAADSRVVQA